MATENRTLAESSERTLVITRIFDAPRSLVFKAWTEREHRMRWWGPRGFTVTFCEMDLRPGGGWRLSMRSPGGREDRQVGIFREIVRPERLVFTYAFEDAAGNVGHETLVTVTFAEHEGKTKLTVNQAVFETAAVRDDHVHGWGEALDRLSEYVATA
ncbi:MAG: SRPBCC domain-containing protein [Candidatus Binataceae bacterium]